MQKTQHEKINIALGAEMKIRAMQKNIISIKDTLGSASCHHSCYFQFVGSEEVQRNDRDAGHF
jgi:hypothetical protein